MQNPQVLSLLLLSLILLGAEGAPRAKDVVEISETSGDELLMVPRDHTPSKLESLSKALAFEITRLRDEHFADEWPKDSMESYKEHKIPMPHLVQEDGCFSKNFSKKRCLNGIVINLQLYGVYLKFVEREYSRSTKVAHVISRTETLTRNITEKTKSAKVEKLDSSSTEALHDMSTIKTDWEKKITAHVILREFGIFMAETYRAIRHINQRSRREEV